MKSDHPLRVQALRHLPTDQMNALARRAQDGDPQARTEFVRRVLRLLIHVTRGTRMAAPHWEEDILSAALAGAWAGLCRWPSWGGAPAVSWAAMGAREHVNAWMRAMIQQRALETKAEAPASAPSPLDVTEQNETASNLARSVEALPPRMQTVIRNELAEVPRVTSADQLGLTVGGVAHVYLRALEELRKPKPGAVCAWCGDWFVSDAVRIYCSHACHSAEKQGRARNLYRARKVIP